MEPNTFSSVIHGKANRISLVLIYALLEWTLIFFLLLNSLFSYLILKFAHYFGLKPPCLLCSRLDHIFEPHNSEPCYRNLICEHHSIELSKSGYCFTHRKLVESQDMRFHCSSSHSDLSSTHKPFICSCCGTHLELEPNSGVARNGNFVSRDGQVGSFDFQMDKSDQGLLFSLSEKVFSLVEAEEQKGSVALDANCDAVIKAAYANDIILPQHLEFYIDNDDYELIPVELLNLDQEKVSQVWRETDYELVFEPDRAVLPAGKQNSKYSCLDILELNEPNAEDLPSKELNKKMEMEDDVFVVRLDETKIETLATTHDSEELLNEEVARTTKSDRAKIEDLVEEDENKVEKVPSMQEQAEETTREIYLEAAGHQEPCVSLVNSDDDNVTQESDLDVKIPSIDSRVVCHKESNGVCENNDKIHLVENGISGSEGDNDNENELNEVDGDRAPDTPTSIDSFQLLHRRLLLIGRSKTANEGSLNGSFVNDAEYFIGEATMEELKSELRAERKAFHALYEELEEERNAAAVAASQTMAMINRLHEEKAAIEMEALQYQRMMEEQVEYDHEALRLMNEILVKRERELEACMNKLIEYEEQISSVSCSNEEEISGTAIIVNGDSKENGLHHPSDKILNIKESLSCFEDERLSILDQLKVLEENLCSLAEEEEHQIRNLDSFERFYQENTEKLKTTNGSKAKQLYDDELFGEVGGRLDPFLMDGIPLTEFGSEKRRFTIEEEVERLYERLQALEEDKEFIKHGFGSLSKGDRGIDLLQEILQHLRDLKSVEFRARNVDGVCLFKK